jgi:hypothetical protein
MCAGVSFANVLFVYDLSRVKFVIVCVFRGRAQSRLRAISVVLWWRTTTQKGVCYLRARYVEYVSRALSFELNSVLWFRVVIRFGTLSSHTFITGAAL